MPETESSSGSHLMNDRITNKLREYAVTLRQRYREGHKIEALQEHKAEMLTEIYRMLCIHLGEPPTEFEWQWRDKDKAFHRDGVISPHDFFQRHVATDLDGMVCLIHCPTLEYNRLYTINFLGNVVGGHSVRYLNVEMDVMKSAAVSMIKNGKPVWFGCDVGKSFDRDMGLMDIELFDYAGLYGTHFRMSKAQRLDYGASLMTHAMVFTGVDIDDSERPRKWRVENSWGEKGGDKGFMVMTDDWFNEYNYEVVVEKQYVSPELLQRLDTEPVGLPPWHPMGSLAFAACDI
jgi:bleomycin hydrolase